MIDTYYAYYYEQLNSRDQTTYRALLNSFRNMSEQCQLTGVYDVKRVSQIMEMIHRDYPGIFYLRSDYSYRQESTGLTIINKYHYSREAVRQMEQQIVSFINQFQSRIATPSYTAYYRLLGIQMYLQRNVKYDSAVSAGRRGNQEDYSIIGPLMKKVAVCQGIAFTVKLLCDAMKIKCIVVAGDTRQSGLSSSGGHAWNMVWVDGKTYHMDVTGDLLKEKASICKDRYFLVDDSLIEVNHVWDRRQYPACRWADLDYYSYRGLVVSSRKQIQELLYEQICRGEREISFRCKMAYISQDELLDIAQNTANQFCKNYNRSGNEFRRISLRFDQEFKIALITYSA